MAIFPGDLKSALKRGTSPLDSKNSTCATSRGHLSNSWAFVVFVCAYTKAV